MASDWAALGALFDESNEALRKPKTSYGVDGPVKVSGITPGSIGPPMKAAPTKPKKVADPNQIWGEDEVSGAGDIDDIDDGRKQPEYELVFKQNISPEDMFLGADPLRHPGISCSDAIVLKVTLPDTKLAQIDLDVRPTFVRIGAPSYKLKVHLPEKVNDQKGDAKWDASKTLLTVTLPVVHEWDVKFQNSASHELD